MSYWPKCPICLSKTKVDTYDSRGKSYGVRRRRQCRKCKGKFSTIEVPCKKLRSTEKVVRAIKALAIGDIAGAIETLANGVVRSIQKGKQSCSHCRHGNQFHEGLYCTKCSKFCRSRSSMDRIAPS